MNVGQLVYELLAFEPELPVVYKGPDYAANLPCEITAVDQLAHAPDGGLVSRGACCMIQAYPDA